MRLSLTFLFLCLAFPSFAGPKEVAAYKTFERVCIYGAASPKSYMSRTKGTGSKRISVGEAKWKYGTTAKMWRFRVGREALIVIDGNICRMQFEMVDYVAMRELFEKKFEPRAQFEDETLRSVQYAISVNRKKKSVKVPVTVIAAGGKIASNKNMVWLTAMPQEEFKKLNETATPVAEPCVAAKYPAKCS